MSALLRPVGPQPAAVYWFRRALLLAIAGVVVFGVVKLAPSGSSDQSADAASSASTPPSDEDPANGSERDPSDVVTDQDPSEEPNTAGDADGSDRRDQSESADGGGEQADQTSADAAPEDLPLCLTQDIALAVEADEDKAEAGTTLTLTVLLETEGEQACRVEANPRSLQVQVLADSDRVWVSEHCPSTVPTGPLTLEPGETRSFSVDWPGTHSAEECPDDQQDAEPGQYQARAILGELVSAPQRFDMV